MGVFRRFEHVDLMGEMIQRTGARLTDLDGYLGESVLRNTIGRCLMCRKEEECRAWLAGADEGGPPPEFCANAKWLTSLQHNEDHR